ncbi:MAG: hypothetical protein ABJP45_04845 [Cyclobacteriaceae bacterium]
MNSLFDCWKEKIPKYSENFKDSLFASITQYGGGAERTKSDLGKHFSNAYELYMYAFFLGLYRNELSPIPKGQKKVDFSHHIQYWGNKGNRLDRTDFSNLQDFMFMALVAKTDMDILKADTGELSEEDLVNSLIQTMESYTNGGLVLIKEKLEDNPNYFLQATAFLDFMLESTNQPSK